MPAIERAPNHPGRPTTDRQKETPLTGRTGGRVRTFVTAAALIWLAMSRVCVRADEPAANPTKPATKTWSQHLQSLGWTAGGMQFWTDVFIHGEWRIQQHATTGHHRLLDDHNVRRASGTYADCRSKFDALKRELKLPPMKRQVVVTIHGLGRTRRSMEGIGRYLAESGGYTLINMSYASTRNPIDVNARALADVIDHLEGVETIHIVAHSLGNLVTRHYLADLAAAGKLDAMRPRFGRMVMLAPPNQGSSLAVQLKDNPLFRVILGATGGQLARQWDQLSPRLATPNFEFGIIAGRQEVAGVANTVVEGDDDFVVSVAETRLASARDFLVVPVLHTYIMEDPEVRQSTLRFLQHGYFVVADQRQPIEALGDMKAGGASPSE